MNEDNSIKKVDYHWNEVEELLINQNKKYYSKVLGTKVYKDKIYPKLLINKIRDKILNGKLLPNKCSNQEVYEYISLLKTNWRSNQLSQLSLILKEE